MPTVKSSFIASLAVLAAFASTSVDAHGMLQYPVARVGTIDFLNCAQAINLKTITDKPQRADKPAPGDAGGPTAGVVNKKGGGGGAKNTTRPGGNHNHRLFRRQDTGGGNYQITTASFTSMGNVRGDDTNRQEPAWNYRDTQNNAVKQYAMLKELDGHTECSAFKKDYPDKVTIDGEDYATGIEADNCRGFKLNPNVVTQLTADQPIPFRWSIMQQHQGQCVIEVWKIRGKEPDFTGPPTNKDDIVPVAALDKCGVETGEEAVLAAIPGDKIGNDCQKPGDCILRWYWRGANNQKFANCADIIIKGGGGPTAGAANARPSSPSPSTDARPSETSSAAKPQKTDKPKKKGN